MVSLFKIFRTTRRLRIEAMMEVNTCTFQMSWNQTKLLDLDPDSQYPCLGHRDIQLLGTLTKGHNLTVLIFLMERVNVGIKRYHCLWLSSCTPCKSTLGLELSNSAIF